MALDQAEAKRLWSERYEDELRNTAFKNKYLDPEGMQDPDNLFSELAQNVFLKAVTNFDVEKVTFTDDKDRAFNSFFQQIKGQYLANLAEKAQTGKSTYFREKQRSLDKPLKDEGDGSVTTFLDLMESHNEDPDMQIDLNRMVAKLPEDLAGPVKYIVENVSRGGVSEVMKTIRDRWGWTPSRLYNALAENQAFAQFVTEI